LGDVQVNSSAIGRFAVEDWQRFGPADDEGVGERADDCDRSRDRERRQYEPSYRSSSRPTLRLARSR
jgi:hypothetical protein